VKVTSQERRVKTDFDAKLKAQRDLNKWRNQSVGERYFLTGALGCIGAWIVKQLTERGATPVVFDQGADTSRLDALMPPAARRHVELVMGDITSGAEVLRALEASGARKVIHLAGVQVPVCRANPAFGALVNVVGTLHVFEAAREMGIDRVVYASSAAVFGKSEDERPVDEGFPTEPTTHYGWFKRTNEGNARVYFQEHGLSSIGLRPYTVYGVGRDTGLTSDPTEAMRHVVARKPFTIRFSGPTDFLFAADAAAAFLAAADRAPGGAHVFNLHGETATIEDFVSRVETIQPEARGLIRVDGPPIPMPPALDDAAFRAAVPGVPTTSLSDGIAATLAEFERLQIAVADEVRQ
jgi:nucleoside-diphosphate-sugar epimerase